MAARANKRAQIIDAARRCFYEQGITATGVDTIAEAAGVSKRTLYNHFASKDDLVLAYIDAREQSGWRTLLNELLDGVEEPVERILAYFDAYFYVNDDEEFRGCALINAAAEVGDPESPVLARLRTNKDRVHREIAQLVREAGMPDPDSIAETLVLLLEGSVALYGIRRDGGGAAAAKQAARRMLEPWRTASASG